MTINPSVILQTDLPLPLFIRGKVRDSYRLGDHLLIVATDRISAFDMVLPCGIPNKGHVLNQLSVFWFAKTHGIVPNHMIQSVEEVDCLDNYLSVKERFAYPAYLTGRSMIVKKAERLPVECVVRGFLAGSGWTEYRESGTICGIRLPRGLRESQELPNPIFTPTTKAETGHDQPITMQQLSILVGRELSETVRERSIAVYNYARAYARERGIIIADTKMEFGLEGRNIILIDELLTPDSSRFWDANLYEVGHSQDSYDKQPVRDWLVKSGWDRESPPPMLPVEVVEATTRRYETAFSRLTGTQLAPGR